MNRRAVIVLGVLLTFAVAVIIGCGGSSSKSTNPGGGGPTFDLRFPSQQFTFTTAGSWDYHCSAHNGMVGVVVVDAASLNDSALVDVSSAGMAPTFTPSSVTIKPNGHVRWVNKSTMTNHTVTRP
jgi:hypothetical protein